MRRAEAIGLWFEEEGNTEREGGGKESRDGRRRRLSCGLRRRATQR